MILKTRVQKYITRIELTLKYINISFALIFNQTEIDPELNEK